MKEKKPEETKVNAHAEGWLANLPEAVRPNKTAEQYPRIVNRLASLWKHQDEFIEYIDDLLVDARGGRAGFPLAIALELANVKDHYEMDVHPERSKAYLWDPRQKGK